jgi:hypothetical protein
LIIYPVFGIAAVKPAVLIPLTIYPVAFAFVPMGFTPNSSVGIQPPLISMWDAILERVNFHYVNRTIFVAAAPYVVSRTMYELIGPQDSISNILFGNAVRLSLEPGFHPIQRSIVIPIENLPMHLPALDGSLAGKIPIFSIVPIADNDSVQKALKSAPVNASAALTKVTYLLFHGFSRYI